MTDTLRVGGEMPEIPRPVSSIEARIERLEGAIRLVANSIGMPMPFLIKNGEMKSVAACVEEILASGDSENTAGDTK